MANRLKNEKSPYLLQHGDNPVNWYPWGDEAFKKAEEENKPIFLSIGYSTCHWCHVMAHESFEDEKVAELHRMATALAHVMNPGARELWDGETAAAPAAQAAQPVQAAAPVVDTVAELQKYKMLLDTGVITEEEFAAKKKQLLGI